MRERKRRQWMVSGYRFKYLGKVKLESHLQARLIPEITLIPERHEDLRFNTVRNQDQSEAFAGRPVPVSSRGRQEPSRPGRHDWFRTNTKLPCAFPTRLSYEGTVEFFTRPCKRWKAEAGVWPQLSSTKPDVEEICKTVKQCHSSRFAFFFFFFRKIVFLKPCHLCGQINEFVFKTAFWAILHLLW